MTLVKLGGELLEDARRLAALAGMLARVPGALAIVHGGGREIDTALTAAGILKRQVEGIRVTDPATLEVVVGVLAGRVNTRFVAALVAAGARAVGLTGVDAGLTRCAPAPPHRTADGREVDLGLVGEPAGDEPPTLLSDLMSQGYVPVVASIAADRSGALYNVNADTLAASLAARLGVERLVIAGATAGVLDEGGRTIPSLDTASIERLVQSGVASAGMVAKLRACRDALAGGVAEVVLVDGREADILEAAIGASVAGLPATRMVA